MDSKWKAKWVAFRKHVRDFDEDEPFQLAAATSYYTLLSLAPLLLIVVAVAGLVFERAAVQESIVSQIRYLAGEQGAEAMKLVLGNASGPSSGLSLVIGVVTLLIGASTVFQALRLAFNKIWNVEAKPDGSTWKDFIRNRVLSFAMVLAIGFLLLVSLVLSAALSAFANWFHGTQEELTIVWQALNAIVSLLVVTLLFALLFKFLPDAKTPWRHVWFGAFLTAVLFTLGKQAIGVYLGHASIGSSYGAAGSVVVLTVWVYYASLILFVGAKITHVRAQRALGGTEPADYAQVRTQPAERHAN